MGGSGSQRHREGVKDSVKKGTGALTWTLEGAGLGVGDLTESTPFPQPGMRIVKKKAGKGMERTGWGSPTASGPHPVSWRLSCEPWLWLGCGELSGRTGASGRLASLYRLRGALTPSTRVNA